MQLRTKNEKILLAILIGIVFFGGNFYGYRWLVQKQASLNLTCASLRADKAEAEVDLQKEDFWSQRRAWIQKHQPALGNEGEAKAQVLEDMLKGARNNKLDILEQSLNDVQQGPSGEIVNVSLKVKGSMEGLCRWLTGVERPNSFYAVSSISLKADQDQQSMICTLQLARYFKEGS